ncbi:hypothetical protein C1645_132552 [Glomus cerebriforme]|uniref:Uncharacterized protein n=1 Tax=Glomus cerebriforme TaxID=658196 RepID=A0A397T7K6_9GLOM|nr:hypothetical protein C1645_132552 [Glomus cerebriforme]
MELNKNNENSFDPTPKLKSSPIPITFVSFNRCDYNCNYCGEEYTETVFGNYLQKYCKNCLSRYITDITDNDTYLDVYFYTKTLECNEHEISGTKEPQNIQECCTNCLEILLFKQIPTNSLFFHHFIHSAEPDYTSICNNVIESKSIVNYVENHYIKE